MSYSDIKDYVSRDESSSTGRALAGFLVGAGIGIVAGLLLAPQSGKDTLRKLGEQSNDWKDQLSGLFDKASSYASEYGDRAKAEGERVVRKAKDLA